MWYAPNEEHRKLWLVELGIGSHAVMEGLLRIIDLTHNCLLSMEIEPKDPFSIVRTIGRE